MGKSTRPVYWGCTLIIGHTVVGDMLEWAHRLSIDTTELASPTHCIGVTNSYLSLNIRGKYTIRNNKGTCIKLILNKRLKSHLSIPKLFKRNIIHGRWRKKDKFRVCNDTFQLAYAGVIIKGRLQKKCNDRILKYNNCFNKQNLLFFIVPFISLANLLFS